MALHNVSKPKEKQIHPKTQKKHEIDRELLKNFFFHSTAMPDLAPLAGENCIKHLICAAFSFFRN